MRVGKREDKRKDKSARVIAAGRKLFADRPFDEVTTAELAKEAGLTTGTFFRYAGSKAELLIAVYSSVIEEGLANEAALDDDADLRTRLLTLFDPIVVAAEQYPDNLVAFQREVLFGYGMGPHREAAIESVINIERRIKKLIPDDTQAANFRTEIGGILYASVYMSLVRLTVNTLQRADLREHIANMVDFLLPRIVSEAEK